MLIELGILLGSDVPTDFSERVRVVTAFYPSPVLQKLLLAAVVDTFDPSFRLEGVKALFQVIFGGA